MALGKLLCIPFACMGTQIMTDAPKSSAPASLAFQARSPLSAMFGSLLLSIAKHLKHQIRLTLTMDLNRQTGKLLKI